MMLPYVRNLRQDALYWPPAFNDGQGGLSFGEPIYIRCRWQDRVSLVRDSEGREVTSSAVVYVDRELEAEGLLLGEPGESAWVLASGYWDDRGFWRTDIDWDYASPPPPEARQIVAFGSSPSLRATTRLLKAWLL